MHAGLRRVAEFGLRRVRLVSERVVLDVEPTAEIGNLALNAVPTGEGMRIGNGFRVFVAFHDRHALVLAVLVRAGRDQIRAALRAASGTYGKSVYETFLPLYCVELWYAHHAVPNPEPLCL